MPGFDIGPFQNIVNVGWSSARVVMLQISGFIAATSSNAPPTIQYDFNISVGGHGGEVLRHSITVARGGAVGSPPAITQVVSSDMLRYYAIWSYPPYKLEGEVEQATGGNFWFINIDEGAVHPDFVFSPYASVEAAEAYIDEQHLIYPEYAGNVYIIAFFPPFDNRSQEVNWRALVFINLAAFPKDINGNVQISFSGIGTAIGENISFNSQISLMALLFRQQPFNFLANANNELLPNTITQIFAALLSGGAIYTFQREDEDAMDVSGTMVVHAADPSSITGPGPPDGGGEGGPG